MRFSNFASTATAVWLTTLNATHVTCHVDPAQTVFDFSGPAQSHKKAITPELAHDIEAAMRQDKIPGLALGVFHRDGTSEFGAWGNKTEEGEAVNKDTLFILASVSKAFLSASIGILIDDYAHGRNATPLPAGVDTFDWDTKIKALLPEDWAPMDRWANEKASLKDVLSHVSGLPRHDFSYGPNDTLSDAVHKLQHLRPAFELRETFSYNNMMYMLGAHLITTHTGSYARFVEERIWAPLNMTSTTYSPSKAAASGKLTQSWITFGRRIPTWQTEGSIDLNQGPGGVISSMEDLEKWVRTLMNGGVDPRTNKTIIPPSAFAAVTSVHAIMSGTGDSSESILGYGMGWARRSYLGHDVIEHSGGIPGFSTKISFLPSSGLGIVVLSNADMKSFPTAELPQRIIRDIYNLTSSIETDPVSSAASNLSEWLATTRSESTSAPSLLPLEDYAGTYTGAGYGTLELCAPASMSRGCSAVLAEFATFDAAANTTTAQLLAAWPRIWASHLRLPHVAGHRFLFVPTSLFPNGYGRDTTPFETADAILEDLGRIPDVEFVVEEGKVSGFGLSGTVEGATPRAKEARVQDRADVWFERDSVAWCTLVSRFQ